MDHLAETPCRYINSVKPHVRQALCIELPHILIDPSAEIPLS
jgi:hypothetical protein